jgi:hypothetical protein
MKQIKYKHNTSQNNSKPVFEIIKLEYSFNAQEERKIWPESSGIRIVHTGEERQLSRLERGADCRVRSDRAVERERERENATERESGELI